MNSIKLPVETNPSFDMECYHNFRLSIVLSQNCGVYWQLGHFVNLTVRPAVEDRFPMIRFEDHLNVYSNILEEKPISLHENMDLLPLIRQVIDRGHYVLIYLNWGNIPGSNFYNKQSLVHEGLLFGYNDSDETFDLLAFEVNQESYSQIKVTYKQCLDEFRRLTRDEIRTHMWFAFYGFPMAIIRIKEPLSCNLDYTNLFFALERRGFADSDNPESMAIGYPVHLYMSQYFSELGNGRPLQEENYTIWLVFIHKMLHHNKLMLKRLQIMSSEFEDPFIERLVGFYSNSRNCLKKIKSLSIQYQRNKQVNKLFEISNMHEKVYNYEKRAATILQEVIVRQRLPRL
jgi:hypothetical protein